MGNPGIYIHFPFCRGKCNYCAFYSMKAEEQTYHNYNLCLLRDLKNLEFFIDPRHPPDTLYFGGGTPSLFALDDLAAVMSAPGLKHEFREITIEMNPGTVEEYQMERYRKFGISRVSIGVQSLDDGVLKMLGRLHDARQALQAVESAQEHFENFGVDIIFAIPGFPSASCYRTIETLVTSYSPPHISAYCLTIEEGTPFAHLETDEEQFRREYVFLHEYLVSHGYRHYEVSNFALENRESLHNSKYWDRTPYLGIGPAAHSLWDNRRFCYTDLDDFTRFDLVQKYRTSQPLTPSEIREEAIFLGARTSRGMDIEGLQLPKDKLQRLTQDRLITLDRQTATATLEGWMVLNRLVLELV